MPAMGKRLFGILSEANDRSIVSRFEGGHDDPPLDAFYTTAYRRFLLSETSRESILLPFRSLGLS